MRDVWITGVGGLSGAGEDIESLKRMLLEGRSAVRRDVDRGEWASRVTLPEEGRDSRRLDRAGRLFRAACEIAWKDAGLFGDGIDGRRIGLFEGSSWGPIGEVVDEARQTPVGQHARRTSRYSMVTDSHDFVRPDPEGRGIAACSLEALGMAPATALVGEGPWHWHRAQRSCRMPRAESRARSPAAYHAHHVPQADRGSRARCQRSPGNGHGPVCDQAGVIPATIGTDTPDPALPGCFVVIEPSPAGEGDVMLLSESSGGRCAALVLRPA